MGLSPGGFAPEFGIWAWSMWLLESCKDMGTSCSIQVEGFEYMEAHSFSLRKNTGDPFPGESLRNLMGGSQEWGEELRAVPAHTEGCKGRSCPGAAGGWVCSQASIQVCSPFPGKPAIGSTAGEDFDALISAAMEADRTCGFPRCKASVTTLGQLCHHCQKLFCLSHHIPEVRRGREFSLWSSLGRGSLQGVGAEPSLSEPVLSSGTQGWQVLTPRLCSPLPEGCSVFLSFCALLYYFLELILCVDKVRQRAEMEKHKCQAEANLDSIPSTLHVPSAF